MTTRDVLEKIMRGKKSAKQAFEDFCKQEGVSGIVIFTGYNPVILLKDEFANRLKTGGLGGNTIIWTEEKCLEEAKKYNTRTLFKHKSKGAYDACKRNGWLGEVYKHMKEPNYWTKENCIMEASKYKTMKEFKKFAGGAYNKACKNRWLSELKLNKQ